MSTNSTLITTEFKDAFCILTINREDKLNALSSQVFLELKVALIELKQRSLKNLRGVILTGAGEKAFIAGADIAEMTSMTSEQAHAYALFGQEVSFLLEEFPIPVIAAVNGFALGGGLEMALACDFILCSKNAVFGFPEVKLGLIPGFGGTQRLAKVVGRHVAKKLIYTGASIKVDEALKIGLVLESFENKTALIDGAINLLKMMETNSPLAISKVKSVINQGVDFANRDGLKLERDMFAKLFASYDMQEGTKAFVEKRKAEFKGE